MRTLSSSSIPPFSLPSHTHNLTPLFIPAFPAPFTNASPSSLTTFHAMIKAHTKHKSLTSLLQIHIFTLLHHYRTQPKKTPKPPRDNLIKTKHLSNNLKQQISVKSSYEFDCLDLTIRLAYRAVEQKVIFYKTETIKALYN